MVKGIAKQAVILQPGEKSGFEQAIFILAPDKEGQKVGSVEEMLELADSIVAEHTVPCLSSVKKSRLMPYVMSFLLGGGLTALGFIFAPGFFA